MTPTGSGHHRLLVLGVIVGFVVISMYLPMFKVYDTIK